MPRPNTVTGIPTQAWLRHVMARSSRDTWSSTMMFAMFSRCVRVLRVTQGILQFERGDSDLYRLRGLQMNVSLRKRDH